MQKFQYIGWKIYLYNNDLAQPRKARMAWVMVRQIFKKKPNANPRITSIFTKLIIQSAATTIKIRIVGLPQSFKQKT